VTQPLDQLQLGKASVYVDQYDANLLFPIARRPKREEIGVTGPPIFFGADLWTAFELSWLNLKGKPQIAVANLVVPAQSSHIVESKSLKLYLNSFNNTTFETADVVKSVIRQDLNQAVWGGAAVQSSVGVKLIMPELFDQEPMQELDGLLLDRLDIECTRYQPAPEVLKLTESDYPVTETLVSHLLKSNCLVTGQPDWGSIQISYTGRPIDQAALLQYLVSFRNHHEFHEQCVERIFMDLWNRCQPTRLTVYARYTRRGGLDINPWRTSTPSSLPPNVRTARQ
jgi:7-cyano-7-deazaguanine reductase